MLNSGKMSYCLLRFFRRNFSSAKDVVEPQSNKLRKVFTFSHSTKIKSSTRRSMQSFCSENFSKRLMAFAASAFKPLQDEEPSIVCRPCLISDREEMIEFMRNSFVTREPLIKTLGANPQNSKKFVSYCIDEALEQNVSFAALDEVTGKICGLRINALGPSNANELNIDFGSNINVMLKFLHYIEDGMVDFLRTDHYMRHVAICVKPSAVHRGIASKLMGLSFNCAVKAKLHYMAAMCSWKLPYKLACKMGYKAVRKLPYDEYAKTQNNLDDAQRQAFMKLAETERCAHVMVKRLR